MERGNGTVSAVAEGTATITVKTAEGGLYRKLHGYGIVHCANKYQVFHRIIR
jgi:uncharacterized protein YjdB